MTATRFGYLVPGAVVAGAVFAAGCAHKAVIPPAEAPVSQTTTSSAPAAPPAKNNVVISEDLRHLCNVDLGNIQEAPKFDFDQAQIREGDRSVLDQIARCVTTGPLKGRALHLVGRADPRGEQEYNMALGSSRGSSVARYLESLGVPDAAS